MIWKFFHFRLNFISQFYNQKRFSNRYAEFLGKFSRFLSNFPRGPREGFEHVYVYLIKYKFSFRLFDDEHYFLETDFIQEDTIVLVNSTDGSFIQSLGNNMYVSTKYNAIKFVWLAI